MKNESKDSFFGVKFLFNLVLLLLPSVPANYEYLPEDSLLRACAELLQDGAQRGPEMVPSWQLEIVCAALTGSGSNSLPPVNWAILIGPLLRLPFGEMII